MKGHATWMTSEQSYQDFMEAGSGWKMDCFTAKSGTRKTGYWVKHQPRDLPESKMTGNHVCEVEYNMRDQLVFLNTLKLQQ